MQKKKLITMVLYGGEKQFTINSFKIQKYTNNTIIGNKNIIKYI